MDLDLPLVRIPLLPPPPTRGGKQFGSSPGKPSELGRVAAGHLARVAGEQERGKLIALLAREEQLRAERSQEPPPFSSSSLGLAVAVWQPMLLDLQQGSDG